MAARRTALELVAGEGLDVREHPVCRDGRKRDGRRLGGIIVGVDGQQDGDDRPHAQQETAAEPRILHAGRNVRAERGGVEGCFQRASRRFVALEAAVALK